MKQEILKRIEQAIDEKVFPGCVFGVSVKGRERQIFSAGNFTYEDSSPKVADNTIYDVASVTKVIPTSLLMLTLVDQGKISLNDKVIEYIPGFGNHADKKTVTIKHLLTYTLNLIIPSMMSLKDLTPDEIVKIVVEAPLREKPGATFLYTNSTAMLMGMIIRKVTGRSIEDLAQETFFNPLKMDDSTFNPENKENIPPTELDDWRGGVVQGVVHDEGTYTLSAKHHLGVAGLFSNVPNILTILEMIMNKGEYNGQKFFSGDIVEQMCTNQLSEDIGKTGLGWQMKHPLWTYIGESPSESTIGQTGYSGCFILYDPENDIVITMISNRTFPKRPKNGDAINAVRSDLIDIVYQNIYK